MNSIKNYKEKNNENYKNNDRELARCIYYDKRERGTGKDRI
jgi:hypothetical protein